MIVTGEKLWLDRGSSLTLRTLPLSYRATRSTQQQRFTWTLPVYTLPRALSSPPRMSCGEIGCLCWEPFVTGEKVWLDPRAFRWPCEHSTTELPSHPVISATTFHLNPTRLHDYTKHFVFVHEFPVGKSTYFLYPSTKDIQIKSPLRSRLFMLGAICNRWKSVARTHGLSLTVQTLYHWATKPHGHLSNNFSPEPYPVTWLH